MTEPAVSVVLPTYHRAPLLGRSIRSVLGQCFTDFEVLVVDDGSTDDTAEVVAGFRDPRVRYFRLARNTGAGAARNAGIRLARGRFLAYKEALWLCATRSLAERARRAGRHSEGRREGLWSSEES
jgi:glycosyltransferase involved in cell wall biosynthesis